MDGLNDDWPRKFPIGLENNYFYKCFDCLIWVWQYSAPMTNNYLSNLAALTSGNITELADLLPEDPANDQLHADLLKMASAIDKKFGLITEHLPIES